MSMDMFESALAAEGVSGPLADIARKVYAQETSSGKNSKTSNRGATGGMQVIPSTFASVADKGWDINDPVQNARAGIRYLSQMHTKAGGDPTLTAVGYYGGPGGIDKARKGIAVSDPKNPTYPDTFQYAQQVLGQKLPQQVASRSPKEGPIVPNQGQAAPVQVAQAPVQIPEEVAAQAPIQLAQAPQQVPTTQLGYVAPKEDWKEFQQAHPDPVTPKALDFGAAPSKFDPLQYAHNANVDFRSFLGKRGRA
jgi:hypothetical protein